MLAKKGDCYRQVFQMDDGTVFMTATWEEEYHALTDNQYLHKHTSLQAIKDEGWKILPLDWDNLSYGDWVEDGGRDKRKVLASMGFGESRVYLLSFDGTASDWYTAKELQDIGWTIIQPETDIPEMTVAEICKELGRKVKIKK